MNTIPYTMTERSITVVLDCMPHTIADTHPNFTAVIAALASGEATEEIIRDLVDIPQAIINFMQGNITIQDRVVLYKGQEINNALSQYILRFMEVNDPALAVPMIAFLDNVMENPSYRAVQGLYEWVQKANMPLTSDGHLLAWKIVDADYKDIRTKRMDNSVGQVVTQPRNMCDEDPNQTCSSGLHFCSYDYLPHYGNGTRDRIMIVKINPRDVVAFPHDYNTSKGRCCRYEVVGEVAPDKVREYFPEDTNVWSEFEKPELAEGQVWMTRDGRKATVLATDGEQPFPIEVEGFDEDGAYESYTVTDQGQYFSTDPDPRDFVTYLRSI